MFTSQSLITFSYFVSWSIFDRLVILQYYLLDGSTHCTKAAVLAVVWMCKWCGNVIVAKGLDLYQVLAPNAFSYLEEFVPVIRKTVQSQVSVIFVN